MSDRPTRVAMLITNYYPHVGGAERQLKSVVPLLAERDLEVTVITRQPPGSPAHEVIDGILIQRVPAPGIKAIASLAYTFGALQRLRRFQPDVVHAYELFSTTTTAILAKRLLGTPVVVKILRGGKHGDIARLRQKFAGGRRLRQFSQMIDGYMVISQEIDNELAQANVPPARRHFIPNGVDVSRFSCASAEEQRAAREVLRLPQDVPIGLFTGRFAPEKRLDQLVRAWNRLSETHPTAKLVLVGTGDEETHLRNLAGPNVMLPGRVDDVVPYLTAADLFVLPSVSEGLSNALLEAMASGLCAVATTIGGNSDLIDDGVNGFLTPPDDENCLHGALVLALDKAPEWTIIGERARSRVLADYDLSVTADRLSHLYHSFREMS